MTTNPLAGLGSPFATDEAEEAHSPGSGAQAAISSAEVEGGRLVTVNLDTGDVLDEVLVIPRIHGKEVAHNKNKLNAVPDLDIDVVAWHDDMIRLILDVRCIGVSHPVDEKSGEITHLATLKVVHATVGKYDPLNPLDDGVSRS